MSRQRICAAALAARLVGALASGLVAFGLAAPAVAVPSVAAPGWVWPVPGPPTVVRGFDLPTTPYGAGHRGVDLAAVPGSPVLSAAAGRVSYAGLLAGRGVVVVVHGALRSTYEPVTAQVRVGQQVAAGQPLGRLATGHCASGCLHWGLLRGSAYLNPLRVLGAARLRLLPLGAAGGPGPPGSSPVRRPVGSARASGAAGTSPPGTTSAATSPPGTTSAATSAAGSGPRAADPPAAPAAEPRLDLRADDRPLGAVAALALLAGLALLVRRPRPRPPGAPAPMLRAVVSASPPPDVPVSAWDSPVDLGSERARRRPG